MLSRQKQILREIIANYFGSSEQELCRLFNVSDKTIKNDIRQINELLEDYNLAIDFTDGRYSIPFLQKQQFLDVYEDIAEEDDKYLQINEYQQRKIYLVICLAKSNDFISMNLLADRLFVSKASISSMIHELVDEIPKLVNTAHVEINVRKGVCLRASEKDIRNLLVRVFSQDSDLTINSNSFKNYLDGDLSEKIGDVFNVMTQFIKDHNIEMSDRNLSKHIAHTLIIAQRYKYGRTLDECDVAHEYIYQQFSQKLEGINLYIPAKELSSLPLNLLNRLMIVNPVSQDIVNDYIREVNYTFKTDVLHEEDSYQLVAHIDELLQKGSYKNNYQQLVDENMLTRLLNAYLLCDGLVNRIQAYLNTQLSYEHRLFLAMHIQTMYRKRIKIVENMLLYNPNYSECMMIKTDLEKHFGQKANIVSVHTRWDISHMLKKEKFSVILATESLLANFEDVPFLKIHPFLLTEDYDRINLIVYKNQPVAIRKGISQIDEELFNYGNLDFKLKIPVTSVKGNLFAIALEPNIPMGVYLCKTENNSDLYILNYDFSEPFIRFHRLVNSFGQMIFLNKC